MNHNSLRFSMFQGISDLKTPFCFQNHSQKRADDLFIGVYVLRLKINQFLPGKYQPSVPGKVKSFTLNIASDGSRRLIPNTFSKLNEFTDRGTAE